MAGPSLLPQKEEKPMPKEAKAMEAPEPAAAPEVEVSASLEMPEAVSEVPEAASEASEVVPEVPEAALEAPVEPVLEEAPAAQEVPPLQAPVEPSQPVASAPAKDRLTLEIESVLEEDLTDLFLKLPPDKQAAFQAKGEETASKIRQIVQKSKINARKIFALIRDWLKVVPGVNKFFLEQEAKIKTDKIILVAEENRRRASEEIT